MKKYILILAIIFPLGFLAGYFGVPLYEEVRQAYMSTDHNLDGKDEYWHFKHP